mmetsp:Transcript_159/g.683  ORF Transcript_159/g.683 Transcript_159/m.683 type:complete len:443 (+) Transcript_159:1766-3094(+)
MALPSRHAQSVEQSWEGKRGQRMNGRLRCIQCPIPLRSAGRSCRGDVHVPGVLGVDLLCVHIAQVHPVRLIGELQGPLLLFPRQRFGVSLCARGLWSRGRIVDLRGVRVCRSVARPIVGTDHGQIIHGEALLACLLPGERLSKQEERHGVNRWLAERDGVHTDSVVHHALLRDLRQLTGHQVHAASGGQHDDAVSGPAKVPIHVVLVKHVESHVDRLKEVAIRGCGGLRGQVSKRPSRLCAHAAADVVHGIVSSSRGLPPHHCWEDLELLPNLPQQGGPIAPAFVGGHNLVKVSILSSRVGVVHQRRKVVRQPPAAPRLAKHLRVEAGTRPGRVTLGHAALVHKRPREEDDREGVRRLILIPSLEDLLRELHELVKVDAPTGRVLPHLHAQLDEPDDAGAAAAEHKTRLRRDEAALPRDPSCCASPARRFAAELCVGTLPAR